MVVTDNIDRYCVAHGLSRAEFERQCGIANGLVAMWAKGKRSPSVSTITTIAAATRIPLTAWLTEGGVNGEAHTSGDGTARRNRKRNGKAVRDIR